MKQQIAGVGDPQQLYRTLLEHMIIHPDRSVEIYLKGLPFGFRLWITTSGKMEYYRTGIISMELTDPQFHGRDLS